MQTDERTGQRAEGEYTRASCGQLRATDEGRLVDLRGWVHRRRDQGALIFIDLRDRDGITQVVFNRELDPEAHRVAEQVRSEYVLAVRGQVHNRGPERTNPNLDTGEIEVAAREATVLNPAKPLPFEVASSVEPDENLRLKYR